MVHGAWYMVHGAQPQIHNSIPSYPPLSLFAKILTVAVRSQYPSLSFLFRTSLIQLSHNLSCSESSSNARKHPFISNGVDGDHTPSPRTSHHSPFHKRCQNHHFITNSFSYFLSFAFNYYLKGSIINVLCTVHCAVSVGKTEYQSVGREDFSFPVTSIRENLVIMLCDSEGNLMTKQEVKTISVAEKGHAEIDFSLAFRGNIKLRLTFVLNEKDKEKIRELRSSVLKRKHEELIKGTNDICSPGTSLQLASKDYSNLSNQKMPKISISQSVDDLTGADNNRSVPNRTRSDNIKKMISAFESNAKQNSGSQISPRTRTRVNKIDSHTSIESMSYENEDIKQRRISQTLIRRSFSAGDLTEAILQNDPNFAQKPHFNETLTSASDVGVGVNTENRETNLLQRSLIRNQHKEGGLSNEVLEGTLISVSDERSLKVHTENRETNSLQESVVRHQNKEGGLSNEVFHGTLISASHERVGVNIKKLETNLLQKSVTRHQHKDGLSNEVFDGYIFHATSHYQDHEVSRCINELCIDRASYFFEISDTLMPHRLCLTSAPKRVWNFLENFIIRSPHNEKIKLHGVAFDEVQEEIGSRSQTEDPHRQKVGSSILNGWLIEQGARIFIVIVACGTIILNTR